MIETAPELERRAPGRGVLLGRSILLAASVPELAPEPVYRRVEHAQLEIEHAVISLARAVFAEGGALVLAGSPTLAPLVALVAGEYLHPRRVARGGELASAVATDPWHLAGCTPLRIHQLSVCRDELAGSLRQMEMLGQVAVHWHLTDGDEAMRTPSGELRFPRSLRRMRAQVLRDASIAAMVCIGGTDDLEEQVEMFAAVAGGRRIYALTSTGGAAALLAERAEPEQDPALRGPAICAIDRKILADLRPRLRAVDGELVDAPLRYAPYPLIMQAVVQEVASSFPAVLIRT